MSEEAFNEKADMIVQIMNIGGTITPNGTTLIPAELMQQGIIDVLNDDGSLETVQQIFNTYEQYETQLNQLMNNIDAREQQARIDAVNEQDNVLREALTNNINQRLEQQNIDRDLSSVGL